MSRCFCGIFRLFCGKRMSGRDYAIGVRPLRGLDAGARMRRHHAAQFPMTLSRDRVETALEAWVEPHLGTDLVSAGALREVSDRVVLEPGFPLGDYRQELAAKVRDLLEAAGTD